MGCPIGDGITVTFGPEVLPSCANFQKGSLVANVSGGIPPYTYNWERRDLGTTVSTTNTLYPLRPGLRYYLEVKDSQGCNNQTAFLRRPGEGCGCPPGDGINAFFTNIEEPSCLNNGEGVRQLDGINGVGPYLIEVANITGGGYVIISTDGLIDPYVAGDKYEFSITDAEGCNTQGRFGPALYPCCDIGPLIVTQKFTCI
jgi:hypothetical protein